MNLTKLFNFKYFKENLKKSKGIVALLLIIVPIFTTLFTVLVLNGESNINTPSKTELIIINILGMYVIPILMSLVLFGYVFKKKSVDFINSQPINRKTIFITNTIGGILLMAIIQAITAVMILICGLVLPNLIIFPEMILDIFVMMWISYSFTFIATNLAMTVSGTFCTQIVLTMLILFLVPFCIDSYFDFSNGSTFELINGEKTYNQYFTSDTYYTMPYEMFHMTFSNTTSEFNLYSGRMISRMIVLGLIYYFVGLHLFKTRKMENNEESFFNEKIHIVVKALTMLPMMIVLNMLDAGKEFNIIVIAIIITYYFIYDFIVKRKIKLKSSLVYLVLTLAILQGVCSSMQILKEANPLKKLNVNNIAEVKLYSINEEIGNMHYTTRSVEMGGFLKDEELIKALFDSAYKQRHTYGEDYIVDTMSSDTVVTATLEDVATEPQDIDTSKKLAYSDIVIKTKDGRKYSANLTFYQEDLTNILKMLEEKEEYISKIKNSIIKKGIVTIGNYKILENEEKEIILSEIENKINSISFEELRKLEKEGSAVGICKYYYKNHQLIGLSVNDSITPKTLEIVSKHMNEAVIAKLREKESDRGGYFKVYIINPNDPTDWIYLDDDGLRISNFILEQENEVFDVNKPYYTLELSSREHLQFYTNHIEKLNEFIAEEKARRQQEETLQDLYWDTKVIE